ncbi:S49 family peptidase [Enterobacter roggenkampii]|uniref:S49 family peptidase n=1 Tax=Enterobacter roggenkampii TaxID=1812935 RepID=UPI00277C0DFF|nr:S49 family peptidase [Enterobacter roggenkampii]
MPWRNYQHLAARTFNQPLLLEPAYARVFFSALSERFGTERLIDATTGAQLAGEELKQLASSWDKESRSASKSYRVERGIAILPVTGTLVHKFGYMQPVSGMTGYDGIAARLQQAVSDPAVKGILLDIDSPGGEVSGAFDTADLIVRAREQKPVWCLASDMACSAGYLLASACTRRLITQTGGVGSIGVVVAHRSVEKALELAGVDVTLIYAGSHKVDGNPFEQLPSDVRDEIQASIDSTRDQFAQKVADYTGLKKAQVLATEAAVYTGQEAIKAGLADQIVNYADAIQAMADALNTTKPELSMTTTTAKTEEQVVTLTTEQISAQAASNELARVMSIIGCDEAKGREQQAHALAAIPSMTLDQAKAVLAAAPQTAQARTETALDALMAKESPEAVADMPAQHNHSADGSAAKISLLVQAGKSLIEEQL